MMTMRIFAAIALLAAAGSANAGRILEQPERPYELSVGQITLPSMANGGLSVKRCESCAYSTHLLTAGTEYFVNKRSVPFAEFSEAMQIVRADAEQSRKAFVGVYVDVATGRVNRVTLLHPEP